MPEPSHAVVLAWRIAAHEATSARHQFIEKEHILIGICGLEKVLTPGAVEEGLDPHLEQALRIEVDAVKEMLKQCELDATRLRRALRKALGKGSYRHAEEVIHRSEACKSYFNRAEELTAQAGADEVTCVHLLVAIVERPGECITRTLVDLGVDAEELQQKFLPEVRKLVEPKEPEAVGQEVGVEPKQPQRAPKEKSVTPFLDRYGRDMTKEAREKRIEPIIGRKDEILAVVRSLSRRTKNNPVLIGDAGVGKTAIVEGLAWRIVQGGVDESIRDKRIVQLNMGALVAGTSYRGQFEERLEGCIREAADRQDLILFIDEIHTVVGAGRASGSLDAANILKPALGRGDIRCIGATTIDEYRRYIERDPALERRFQPIMVNEPTVARTVEMLGKMKDRYEHHHTVTIADDAVEAAVELSAKYILDRRLPDKALDLIDEACSRARIIQVTVSPDIQAEERLEREVTWETVAQVVSEKTGIPIARLTEPEGDRLRRMANELKQRVIGQDEAVEALTSAIRRSRLMVRETNRPIGVFFFAGPTGVGKTHLAQCLADFLFGSEQAMIRIDMSEYQEKHALSRLIGAPPGYVGHEEEGQLTGPLRTRPFSVVLLDEVEKAHPDILNLFLQVFEGGRLTDARGRTVDATNAVFIMTSNTLLETESRMGFGRTRGAAEDPLRKALAKQGFRPEFVNRLDRVILFRHLSAQDVERIADIFVQGLRRRITAQHGIHIEVDPEAMKLLCQKGYDQENGARPLRRVIEAEIEEPLTDMILNGTVGRGDVLLIAAKDSNIEVGRKPTPLPWAPRNRGDNQQKEQPRPRPTLRADVQCMPSMNYSLVHCEVPLLSNLTLFHDGDQPRDVWFQIGLSEYAESEPLRVTVPAKGSLAVSPLPRFLSVDHKLRDLPEPVTAPLQIWSGGQQVPLTHPRQVRILPPQAWYCAGHEMASAAFVMPNCDAVQEVISKARSELRRQLKGVQGFADALESSDPRATEQTLKAIYYCLLDRHNIHYEYEPRTYDADWQKVRFHHEVLNEHQGTCIDLALLFAACIEIAHRDPLIILVKTGDNVWHAVIGCWRDGSTRADPIISDQSRLRQWVQSGTILVLDSKGFPRTKEFPDGMTFPECQEAGLKYVMDYSLCYAVDIAAARQAGITPMPFGKGVQFSRPASLAVWQARSEAQKLRSRTLCARHLLLGLLDVEDGLMRQGCARLGDGVADRLAESVRSSIPPVSPGGLIPRHLPETHDYQKVMACAKGKAEHGSGLITEAHLALALLETPTQVDTLLQSHGLTRQGGLDALCALLNQGPIPSSWHRSAIV